MYSWESYYYFSKHKRLDQELRVLKPDSPKTKENLNLTIAGQSGN